MQPDAAAPKGDQQRRTEPSQRGHRGGTSLVLSRPVTPVTVLSVTTLGLQARAESGLGLVSRPERLPDKVPLSLPGLTCRCRATKYSTRRRATPPISEPRDGKPQTLRSLAHTVSSAFSHTEKTTPGHLTQSREMGSLPGPGRPQISSEPCRGQHAPQIRCLGLGDCRDKQPQKHGKEPTG